MNQKSTMINSEVHVVIASEINELDLEDPAEDEGVQVLAKHRIPDENTREHDGSGND